MPNTFTITGFHNSNTNVLASGTSIGTATIATETKFHYKFDNFFHPFIGEMIAKLNRESLKGMLDPSWQKTLKTADPITNPAQDFFNIIYRPQDSYVVSVKHFAKEIDVSDHGPYSNYNWELLYHVPMTIAVHLSKSQRFAEAQRWFHFIFDPTSTDQSVPTPARFWKFMAFRGAGTPKQIDYLLGLLSTNPSPGTPEYDMREAVLNGYMAILNKPFQPYAVARTRHIAFQYSVVMKYLDNLIAWGDHLFQQDTVESINEAMQRYVLAANILGPRPQRVPARGKVRPKTFNQLKSTLDAMGNAIVDLEGQFPFNIQPGSSSGSGSPGASTLFGMGKTLYFCIPPNDKMLGYWDIVADRLFKIRHCMNIKGIVRPLALFDPPIDPGMLVKAAAAGIDIGSIVNGLNQPIGPIRSLTLIQKALELCGEVRNLGGALLTAIEKGEAEHLALMRQRHDIKVQELSQGVRYLQWQSARESTQSLLTSRTSALERLRFYGRVLGLPDDPNALDTLPLDRRELTEENFDEAYSALVGQYEKPLTLQSLSNLSINGASSPSQQSGASGSGSLFLNRNENADLNVHSPKAKDLQTSASISRTIASVLSIIPNFSVELAFWGLGASISFGGSNLASAASAVAEVHSNRANVETFNAGNASKAGSYQRRADDWILQYNLAARELMQNGRQILTSLISEQVAYREYENTKQMIANAQEVDQYLHEKYTNEELYLWMQGEVSRLYYEYYRFAFDTARRAERTMKAELMRPELDAQDFVKFNYWDGGRKGLLSGEALYLDVKRMEMAYHDNNKRELEIVRHVSLRQLDPRALLMLKATGSCQVTVPEWLYDRDCPGHYMRRIKSVALSIPSVVGPYTSVNCTLSLLKSSIRKSPIAGTDYARQGPEDDRFIDYGGTIQSIVTSGASNDSGMFETNLRDERFLPFEGAGAISTWKLDLPSDYPSFDFGTISDVILHIRYTARQGVEQTKVTTALGNLFAETNPSSLAILFDMRHDFPTEWAAFVNGTGDFTAVIRTDHFPYMAQGRDITVTGLELYAEDVSIHHAVGAPDDIATVLSDANDELDADDAFTLSIGPDDPGPTQVLTRTANARVYLLVRYSLD